MSVTIKDIAKLANVSHTTVSRALNNSPLINDETKNKIRAIAEQLRYVPNYNAQNLVLHRSNNIGLFFSSISVGTSPTFFFEVVRGVSSVINENYNLVVKSVDDYDDFAFMDNKRFDGVIMMSQSEYDNALIYHLIDNKIPIVVLDRYVEQKDIVNILSDDRKGSFKAVEYFIKNGHTDIGIIEGKNEFKSSKERKEGFMDALIEYNIPVNKNYIIKGNYDMRSGYESMKELLKLSKVPTAVFCSNDDMAVGAIKAINDNNLKVPDDVSIIGFDDIGFCEYSLPALTTVKRPMEKISIIGAEKLLKLLDKKDLEDKKIYINTQLVVRDSVKKVKN